MGNKKIIIAIMLAISIIGVVFGWVQINSENIVIGHYNDYKKIEDYPVKFGINPSDVNSLQKKDYIMIYDETDELSVRIKNNVSKVLEYAKKDCDIVDVTDYMGLKKEVQGVIICTELLGNIKGIEEIIEYAKQGGSLMLAIRPAQDDAYEIYSKDIGILDQKGFKEESGIILETNLVIGQAGFKMEGTSIINSCLDIDTSDECTVHATTPSGIPLVWDKELGKGKIIVVNGTFFDDRSSRGLIVNTIALMSDYFMYPIINAGVYFLDDFPSPVPKVQMLGLYPNLDLSAQQFYRKVWWPDMTALANKYGFKYTAVLIRSYDNSVDPVYVPGDDNTRENFFYFVPELIKEGGELGYHGFNHQPFTYSQEEADVEDYNAWKSKEDVKEAWRLFDIYIEEMIKNYDTRIYVPPSNMLSQEVRKQFPDVAPNVDVICSLHNTVGSLGVYEQEFEVAEDGIVEFPRISSGYINSIADQWDICNAISMYGVFSHFTHPDDMLDESRREGTDWEDTLSKYKKNLEKTLGKYPWIKMMTASEAGEQVKKFEQAEIYLEENDGVINGYINNFRKDMYFILRTKNEVLDSVNCSYEKIDDGTYWIYTTQASFSLTMKGGE